MKYIIRIVLSFFLLVPFLRSNAQTADNASALEKFILQTMDENNIVGSAVTYFNAKGDLLTKGYGNIKKSGRM